MRRHQNADVLPDKVFRAVTEDTQCCGVRRLDHPFFVEHQDAIRRRIDNGTEPGFALPQTVHCPLLIGNVASRDDRSRYFPPAIADGREIVAANIGFAATLLDDVFRKHPCFAA